MPIIETKVWYIMHPNIFNNEMLSWTIKIWMKTYIVSDNNLQHYKSIMLKFLQKE